MIRFSTTQGSKWGSGESPATMPLSEIPFRRLQEQKFRHVSRKTAFPKFWKKCSLSGAYDAEVPASAPEFNYNSDEEPDWGLSHANDDGVLLVRTILKKKLQQLQYGITQWNVSLPWATANVFNIARAHVSSNWSELSSYAQSTMNALMFVKFGVCSGFCSWTSTRSVMKGAFSNTRGSPTPKSAMWCP